MQTCLNLRLGAVGVLVKHSETQLSSVFVRYDIIYLQGYSGFFWGSGRITYTNHLRECLVLIPNNTAIFACQKGCSLLLIGSHFQQFKLFPLYFFSFLINFFFFFFWPYCWCLWDFSSLTRDWIHAPCTGSASLNHWSIREVPIPLNFWVINRYSLIH